MCIPLRRTPIKYRFVNAWPPKNRLWMRLPSPSVDLHLHQAKTQLFSHLPQLVGHTRDAEGWRFSRDIKGTPTYSSPSRDRPCQYWKKIVRSEYLAVSKGNLKRLGSVGDKVVRAYLPPDNIVGLHSFRPGEFTEDDIIIFFDNFLLVYVVLTQQTQWIRHFALQCCFVVIWET